MTVPTPYAASCLGEISPVNAPCSSQKQSCAPSATLLPFRMSATEPSSVKLGHTTTSASRYFADAFLIFFAKSSVCSGRSFIFQLAMTSGCLWLFPRIGVLGPYGQIFRVLDAVLVGFGTQGYDVERPALLSLHRGRKVVARFFQVSGFAVRNKHDGAHEVVGGEH